MMKRKYENPKLMIELFTPNMAIAACAVNKEWSFDCMKGNEVDIINTAVAVYSGLSCTQNVGISVKDITGVVGARDEDGGLDHTHQFGSWSDVTHTETVTGKDGRQEVKTVVDYIQVTYEGHEAVLYCDSENRRSEPTTTNWGSTLTDNYLIRSGAGGKHHLVAPVKSVQAMS